MNDRRIVRNESSLETLVSFGSEPPPSGDGADGRDARDVHNACTAVASLPASFLDDLRKGKEEPTTSRYKVLPEADILDGDLPTIPPPRARGGRGYVREVNAAVGAALAAAAPAMQDTLPPPYVTPPRAATRETLDTLDAPLTPPAPFTLATVSSFPPPASGPSRSGEAIERWLAIALAVAFTLAVVASVAATLYAATQALR